MALLKQLFVSYILNSRSYVLHIGQVFIFDYLEIIFLPAVTNMELSGTSQALDITLLDIFYI